MAADLSFIVRRARPEDVPSLVMLCVEHAAYEGVQCAGPDPDALHSALFGAMQPLRCWVAEQDGHVVGYATATREFSTWQAAYYLHVDCLYLRPAARGHRLGERLMQALVFEADRLQCRGMQWQTPASNVRAAAFYRRIGAVSLSKLRFYMDDAGMRSLAGAGVGSRTNPPSALHS